MEIDYCLILSAGFGTRMGEIGRKLPKVLWPIFEKSLLAIQIDYALELGCKKIFVNTHFGHDKVIKHLTEIDYLKYVTILHEKEILGAGGAIHKLAQLKEVNYQGHLLTLNGDQFFYLDKTQLSDLLCNFDNCTNLLLGLKVEAGTGYGQVVIEDSIMKEIISQDEVNDYYTYSGVGITKLNLLDKVDGVSRFFDTVADYKNKKVKMLTGLNVDYWDFGTIRRYFDSMFNLITQISSDSSNRTPFLNFLIKINAIDINKICNNSYGTKQGVNVIMLCDFHNDNHDNAIVIDQHTSLETIKDGIYYQGIMEEV